MSATFNISVTNQGGALINLQVSKDMTVELLKSCISADLSIPTETQILTYSGTPLEDNTATLESYGITSHEMLQVSVVGGSSSAATAATAATTTTTSSSSSPALAALQASSPDDDTLIDPSLRMEMLPPQLAPEKWHNIVRLNPQLLAQMEYTNPNLAKALRENDLPTSRGLLIKYQMAAFMNKRKTDQEDQRLNDNPWDTDAQSAIAERIRRANVEQNRQMAMEHHPESFTRVLMLYIPLEVNGVKIQAFVDSGAQSTIMSQECAERCGIMRLVDTNFAGMAVGVGTAKICGRVHLAPIKIGGTSLNCTFTVMDKNLGDKNMEFLLGLDMLKRYQCIIDLQAPAKLILRTGGSQTSVEFLTEGELPESKGGRLAVDPTIAENEATLKRKREEEHSASAAASSSSSSSTSPAAVAPPPSVTPLFVAPTPSMPTPSAAPSVPASATSTEESSSEQLVSEGFSLEAVQKALSDCSGNASMARVVLKFGQSRS